MLWVVKKLGKMQIQWRSNAQKKVAPIERLISSNFKRDLPMNRWRHFTDVQNVHINGKNSETRKDIPCWNLTGKLYRKYDTRNENIRVKSGAQTVQMVTVMLVTSLCWWLYDGDRFEMLVTESLCWWFFSLCWWFFQCIKSVTNILNRSPTSYQHIWSPASVTNIDVAKIWPIFWCKNGRFWLKTFELRLVTSMLVTNVGDQMSWWEV